MAYFYSVITVLKITGIGQLLLKLSLVVGWYFFRHSVVLSLKRTTVEVIDLTSV